ncbi:hypothetical protein BDR03DRAFT_618373 [Suillus americanus]|nr:hypothetical protein BDR03DRAFT_618373 [Suillus americanus]
MCYCYYYLPQKLTEPSRQYPAFCSASPEPRQHVNHVKAWKSLTAYSMNQRHNASSARALPVVASVIVDVNAKTWNKNTSLEYTMMQENRNSISQEGPSMYSHPRNSTAHRRAWTVEDVSEMASLGTSLRRFPACVWVRAACSAEVSAKL